MTRYFCSTLLLFVGMGLPLLGKSVPAASLTPSTSPKGARAVPDQAPAPTVATKTSNKSSTVVKSTAALPSEKSRAMLSAIDAAKPQPATPKVAASSHLDNGARLLIRGTPLTGKMVTAFPTPSHFAASDDNDCDHGSESQRLARVTAYWAGEGDYYTRHHISSTGIHLHDGHCAVDPTIIPYGSVVQIAGVGKFIAVDTGSAVVSRTAAREGGHTSAERHAIVVDVYFEDRDAGERFAAHDAKYVSISWWTPTSARDARGLVAEEDWTKIQGKQL